QGMFRGALVDGPLAPDSALSAEAARARGVKSEISGRVDVLIGHSMESALMVMRTLQALSDGLVAGIVLGARIPIVVPTRHDTMEGRMASCVLAALMMASGNDAVAPKAEATARSIIADAGARAAA